MTEVVILCHVIALNSHGLGTRLNSVLSITLYVFLNTIRISVCTLVGITRAAMLAFLKDSFPDNSDILLQSVDFSSYWPKYVIYE